MDQESKRLCLDTFGWQLISMAYRVLGTPETSLESIANAALRSYFVLSERPCAETQESWLINLGRIDPLSLKFCAENQIKQLTYRRGARTCCAGALFKEGAREL